MQHAKRSRRLVLRRLGVTGLAGGAALSVAACEEPKTDMMLFQTVEQCVQSGLFERDDCVQMRRDAQALHKDSAPRYAERDLCEADFGQLSCQEVRDEGDSYWRPRFSGWAAADLMDLADDLDDDIDLPRARRYSTGAMLISQPFYRTTSRDAPLRTLSGGPLWRGDGGRYQTISLAVAETPKAAPAVLTRTTIASRGGFSGSSRFGSIGG